MSTDNPPKRRTVPKDERILERNKETLWDDLNVVCLARNANGERRTLHIPRNIIGDTEPLCTETPDHLDWKLKPRSIYEGYHDELCESCLQTYNQRQRHSSVTDKQYEALRLALDQGWYDRPKQTDTHELSDELDITHRAFNDRIIRGVRQLIRHEAHRRGHIEHTDQ